ncbi:MAG TPA: 50S ribosomal protein L32 [Candidatus Gastranaerophilales bacterium]|nr:50S ribosomal protein L32 [Candidatus Gastranaerophilales bacterium]
MAVPKKKTGKCAQAHRRAKWKATIPTVVQCPNCKETTQPHTVCASCGFYGGKQVIDKD